MLLGVVTLTSSLAGYYYYQYSITERAYDNVIESFEGFPIRVNIIINFGNGTILSFNNTMVPVGWNMYDVTLLVSNGRIEDTYYPEFDAVLVMSIMGVGGSENTDFTWSAWYYDDEWKILDVGTNLFVLKEGQTVAWYYQNGSEFGRGKPN